MIGQLLGAAGAVETIAAVQAIKTGWVHPNIYLENPEEGIDANIFWWVRRKKDWRSRF